MAGIPNNYEINVAKKRYPNDEYGVHFCRIKLPDSFEEQAREKLEVIRKAFGDDYTYELIYWKCSGEILERK